MYVLASYKFRLEKWLVRVTTSTAAYVNSSNYLCIDGHRKGHHMVGVSFDFVTCDWDFEPITCEDAECLMAMCSLAGP